MKQKQLPFLPANFFYKNLRPDMKAIFIAYFSLLIGFGIFTLISFHDQDLWSLSIEEVAVSIPEEVIVSTVEQNYRSLDIPFTAFRQQVTFTAGALHTHPFVLWVFMLSQWFAWALVFTAASSIRSRWSYLFYLLGALFIHFSGFAQFSLEGEEANLLEFAQIISALGLAYAFQSKMLTWKIVGRFLSFIVLIGLFIFIAWAKSGTLAFAHMASYNFGFLSILSIIFLLFIGKEPTNLLLLFATNRPIASQRLSPRLSLAGFFVLILLFFTWFHEFMDLQWFPLASWGIKPIHLWVISAIALVFTSQNQFRNAQFVFSTNYTYTFLILAWALIVLGFLGFCLSLGDRALVDTLNRLAAMSFFLIGASHVFYLILNFKPLLFKKINFYYLAANGPRMPLYVIWLIGLSLFVFGEGNLSWRSPRVFAHSQDLQMGDLERAKGNDDLATEWYKNAINRVPASNRAHYNLASLLVSDIDQINTALDHYQRATAYFEFPIARMNAAAILQLNGQTENAKKLLLRGWNEKKADPFLANNLARIYEELAKPDSAIICYKAGLQSDLHASSLYSNLANLYVDHEKNEEAASFFQAGNTVSNPSTAAKVNAIYWALNAGSDIDLETDKDQEPLLLYNKSLLALKEKNYPQARDLLDPLLAESPAIEASLLEAWLMFEEDSLEHARSRIQHIQEYQPTYAAMASYMMGSLYLQRNVPEMARAYFLEAGKTGKPEGFLQAAKMELDLGMADSAHQRLSDLRVKEENLWNDCAKELAMILLAYGNGDQTFANTEYNTSQLSTNERIRVSLYADSLNNYITALDNFRAVIGSDSSLIAPYLEMGKIYASYGDSMAKVVLLDGLQVFPANEKLQMTLAHTYADFGNVERAKEIFSILKPNEEDSISWLKLKGKLALADQDTALALQHSLKAYEKNILDTESILFASKLFYDLGNLDLGNALISKAVNLNDQHSELWYWYAKYSEVWGMQEDAGFAAAKAIELARTESRRQEISEEFLSELKALNQENSF